MNNNFISTNATRAPKQIRLWLATSIIVTGIILLLSALIAWHQYRSLQEVQHEEYALAQQLQEFDSVITNQKKLTEQELALKKQLAKIFNHQENPSDPTDILKIVKSYLKNGVALEHAQYATELAELKLSAPEVKTINTVAQQLPTHSWGKGLHMNSLEYKDNGVTAVLKNNQKVT
jgi:hypothetical protein